MTKIAICVFGCGTIEKYKRELMKIIETWGKMAIEYKLPIFYFLGEDPTEFQGSQFIYLPNIGNDYLSASHKQNLGLKYIHDHVDYEYVFCCGTDTYVNIPKLLDYMKHFDSDSPLYVGGDCSSCNIHGTIVPFHGGGGGFVLSKPCVAYLYPKLETMVTLWHQRLVNNQLYDWHDLRYACDVCIAYYLQVDGFLPNYGFVKDFHAFYSCDYQGVYNDNYDRGTVVNLRTLITCHNMSPEKFDVFTKILEDSNYFV